MFARGALLLLVLLLPWATSATPAPPPFGGPSFSGPVATPAALALPGQLTLPPAGPAALTFPFVLSVGSTPRVLPSAGPSNSGADAWMATRGSTGLFTGSIPQPAQPTPPVPEPTTAALLVLGMAILAARRR